MQEVPGYGTSCTLCSYTSKHKDHVRRHIQSRHLQSFDYLCPICGQAFATSNNRQRHIKSKHGFSLNPKVIEEMLAKKYGTME